MNKKIFIDCGTHFFEGFQTFSEKYNIDSTWQCYCFEANPYTFKASQSVYNKLIAERFNITHKQEAISTNNSIVKINCASAGQEGYTNQGSNILEMPPQYDKWYGGIFDYTTEHTITPTIDFAEFLINNTKIEDFVVIKMDIEGSEFSVIDHLIEKNCISLINDIYIEFHERFFDDINFYINKKEQYKQLFNSKNINLFEWV